MTASGQNDTGADIISPPDGDTGSSSPEKTTAIFRSGVAATVILVALTIAFFPVRPYMTNPTGAPEPVSSPPAAQTTTPISAIQLHPSVFQTQLPKPTLTPVPSITPEVGMPDYGCSADGTGTEGCQNIGHSILHANGCPSFTNYYCDHLCPKHPEFWYPKCTKNR